MTTNNHKRPLITISTEAICAIAEDCFSVQSHVSNAFKLKWIDDHDLCMYQGIIYTPVKTNFGREYWMAVMTGTLYNRHGRCMSDNDMTINTRHMRESNEECRDILMSMRARK